MAKIWEPQAIEIYREWANSIGVEASDNLSSWEATFLVDISMRLDKGVNLTEGQANKLEAIYVKHTK